MVIVDTLLSWIAAIPATFWGVIVGSFFTLLGISVTNRATDARQATQLAHDREVKKQERELTLRKEIYMGVAEALQAGLNSMPQFGNLNLSYDDISRPFTEKAPALAKAHGVATVPTAKAIAEVGIAILGATLRLTAARLPLDQMHRNVQSLQSQIQEVGKQCDRWIEQMKQLNLEGNPDNRVWEVVQRNYDFEAERLRKAHEDHAALASVLQERNISYIRDCMAEFQNIQPLMKPVIVAIRKELAIPTDSTAYAEILDQTAQESHALISRFLDSLAGAK